MIELDGMLLIGSADANVGKTALACAIIRRFAGIRDIVGVKVTTIKAKDGQCPRGGQGCGVCSSLQGHFLITEEGPRFAGTQSDPNSHKDTGRLLAAGARRVFWLRVMRTHLEEAMNVLLDTIGRDAVSICESNSLRQVVEPGLFLIVRNHNTGAWKRSAQQVKEYADKIVVSDDTGFDFDVSRVGLPDGKWRLREHATAIILAGGESARMRTDKSMLLINGRAMIQVVYEQLRGTFDQILVSADDAKGFGFLGLEVVPDRVPGQGPLMGIASAMQASAHEFNFIVACDIPRVNLHCVRRMLAEAERADMVVPRTNDGKYEPLFAVYRKRALDAINRTLASGKRKISDAFGCCNVKFVELGRADWLMNLNTMEDYEAFQKKNEAQIR